MDEFTPESESKNYSPMYVCSNVLNNSLASVLITRMSQVRDMHGPLKLKTQFLLISKNFPAFK